MISLNTRVNKTKTFITNKIGEHTVIFDIKKGRFYQLNPTSEIIWKYLWKERSVKELMNRLVKEFNVDYPVAKRDIVKFINDHKNSLFVTDD